MAVSAATLRSDFSGFLPAEIAGPIFERAARQSVVQRLVPQVPLGMNGKSIPVVTGRMAAGWVSEAAAKPASAGTMTLKTMTPAKLAAIAIVSAEVVRANPGGYVNLIREQIAEAFAIAFDYAALYDAGPDGTAGAGPFSTYLAQTTKEVEFGTSSQASGGVHNDLVDALKLLIQDNDALGRRYRLTGFAFDPKVEGILLDAVDTTGRPIWTAVDTPDDTVNIGNGVQNGRVLGRPAAVGELSRGIVCGFAGDFTQAAWGVVGGISYDVSTEAAVTINGSLTSLWENNLVAVRAEAEYGWLMNDADAFVELTDIQTS
jgi:HK97 family phage major capsid protein